MDFDHYRPVPEWFAHNPYGIHGMSHCARVLVWANLIGTKMVTEGKEADIEALRWAAVLHDIGRLSDGIDRGHGERSAKWLAENRSILPAHLNDEGFEKLLFCCRWHEISDGQIPSMTAELTCIKDADGLDRVRIFDLNPEFLRTEIAREFVQPAWRLYYETQASGDPWDAVYRAGIGLGLVFSPITK
jgi:hypothetical protein